MDHIFDTWGDSVFFETLEEREELPENNFPNLISAVNAGNYNGVYRELRAQRFRFSPGAAFQLLRDALNSKLSRKAVEAILERCPPVPEILGAVRLQGMTAQTYGLTEKAAMLGRNDIVKLLLERGAGPNRLEGLELSPIEAALEAGALECVELLLEQPELDTAWTEKLLEQWCVDDEENVAFALCRQAMVPRFLDADWMPLNPVPIPENMPLWLPAVRGNWGMVIRLCRERGNGIGLPEARKTLKCMNRREPGESHPRMGEALDAVLTVCPELLQRETACRTVLRNWLFLGEEERTPLARWVKVLKSRRVAMEDADWQTADSRGDFLTQWETQFPQGPTLVVDRWRIFRQESVDLELLEGTPERMDLTLARILRSCPIRGKGRRGKVSPLAMQVLSRGSPGLIVEQLQPGKLLEQEDANALLEVVRRDDIPRINRSAVLVNLKKEEHYEL